MKLRPLFTLCAALLALSPGPATAQTSAVPGFISYQGRVVDAAGVNVGKDAPVNRTVIFRIWDNPSSTATANLIYSESQTVTVSDGEFSVLVGQGVANTTQTFGYPEADKKGDFSTAFGNSSRYLGVTVATAATIALTDNEITPRQQIVSTAFAMRAKVADSVDTNAISSAMLATGAVGSTQLGAAAVTSAKIATDTITANNIAADAVGTSELAADAVGTSELAAGSVTNIKLGAAAVTSAKIATDTITANNIAAGAVGTSEIADGSVTSSDLGAGTVVSPSKSKILHMRLNAAGNIISSSPGMSISFGGPYNTNTFRINYPSFAVTPTVVATVENGGNFNRCNATIQKNTTGSVDILTSENNVDKALGLNIIVIGND